VGKVQLPDAALSGDDVLPPLQDLLRGLNVLPALDQNGQVVEATLWRGTPQSVAVLEAGAPAVAKVGASIAAALSAAGITLASVGAFWGGLDPTVQRTLITALAVVAAIGIVAVAAIVTLEVWMRLRGSLAIYDVRRSMAMAFMERSVDASSARIAVAQAAADQAEVAKTAHSALVVALAAARSQVEVRCGNTNGYLVGLVEDGGAAKVKFQPHGGQPEQWETPDDVQLLQLSY
jgi:hypothetical protein